MNAPIPRSEEILAIARERAFRDSRPYAGQVTPHEAYELFTAGRAKIIDVRFAFEYEYIGRVPGSILIPWKNVPGGEINREFLPELRRQCALDEVVLLLCRSGIRSHAAAATATEDGFTQVFNIQGGFEGDLDENEQRNRVGGWRHAELPWVQS
jgi:rhodanese-related sulfurtransferase